MSRYYRVLACTVGFVFILFCFTNAESKNDRILLTSFYPIYISALNVADGVPGVKVVNMAKPQTGCLHDYQLTPQDMQLLSFAWALVVNGGGMESFVDKAIKQQPKLTIIEASKGIHFMGTSSVTEINNHDAHENCDHGHATEPANNQQEELNPHIWVSVSGAIAQVKNIRDALIKADPTGKAVYTQNAAKYTRDPANLDGWAKLEVQKIAVSSRKLVTNHDALGYFADRYGFTVLGNVIPSFGTESEPSAKDTAALINNIRRNNVKAIFTENIIPPKLVAQVASETDAKVAAPLYTDALGGVGSSGNTFLKAFRHNVTTIVAALK